MKKDDLVRFLKDASELEETHSAFIAKFFLEDFDWNGVNEEKIGRVREILKGIGSQTLNHGRILNELVGMIEDSDQDEF